MQETGAQSFAERFLPSLQFRDYRNLWMSSLSASAAAWALIVARAWLVYDLTSGSSAWVGLTTFAAMIPLFLVPPVAGFLADKFQRRRLLGYVYALQFAHNLLLAALVIAGVIEPWHLVVLAFFNGGVRAAQMPITQALLPNLVPKTHILNAIALNSATIHGSRLLGAGIVAGLLASDAPGPAFAICSAFYAAAWLSSSRIQSVSTGRMASGESALRNFTAGLRYVVGHPFIRPLVIVVFFHCSLTMSFESMLPVLSDEQLGADGGFSYLMMAVGGGSLVGVMGLSGLKSAAPRGRWLLVAGVVSGISPLGLAFSTSLAPALTGAVFMGASQAAFMALTASFLQEIIPDAIRGRAMSVYLVSLGGVMALFNLVNGALADDVGAPVLLTIAALAFLGILAVSLGHVSLRRLFTQGAVAVPAPA